MERSESDLSAEIAGELEGLPRWRLEADGWSAVSKALDNVLSALERDDRSAISRGLSEVLRLGPTRLGSMGSSRGTSRGPSLPPDAVIELKNRIVHAARAVDAKADGTER
jgi:hypothetical protein